jgi:hypothetical protein
MKKTMLKKIVLGTLLVGLIGILVVGAVLRTMDKTERVAEASGRGYGRNSAEVDTYAAGGSTGLTTGGSTGLTTGGSGQGRGGYGGRGREDAPGDQTGTGQANVEEWLTLQGTVVNVDADTLVVQTVNGEQVTMENRPWWFAQEQGFSAQVGDQVTLIVFYEGDDLEVGQIDDITSGQTVLVRDEIGRPLWAGRGRLGG